ncbi:hypothetical protein SASPL_113676 [Salvia splendens]|uniref:Uncharacterized protein n=1 Tax=Salvia splendens TaxID=180675 RepID=A0A8X9A1A4_SALSN|nr:hypothetical protein SASPL_113676 [Salvia splendens]
MDKKESSKQTSEDATRESLIAISYGAPDLTAIKSPKSKAGENVVKSLNQDEDEKYRADKHSFIFCCQEQKLQSRSVIDSPLDSKAEQEETVRNRPAGQKGLSLKEIRKMDYLNKVIDETLRVVTFSLVVFREAKKDVNVCGYTISKGWKALVWFRSADYDPETWPEPKKFDPSRWDNFTPKAENFIPFGSGSRLCPGNDLAKLEIAIFLHYFLLNYEQVKFFLPIIGNF